MKNTRYLRRKLALLLALVLCIGLFTPALSDGTDCAHRSKHPVEVVSGYFFKCKEDEHVEHPDAEHAVYAEVWKYNQCNACGTNFSGTPVGDVFERVEPHRFGEDGACLDCGYQPPEAYRIAGAAAALVEEPPMGTSLYPAPTLIDANYNSLTYVLEVVFTTLMDTLHEFELFMLTDSDLGDNAIGHIDFSALGILQILGIITIPGDSKAVVSNVDGTGVAKVRINGDPKEARELYFGKNNPPKHGGKDKLFISVYSLDKDYNQTEYSEPREMIIGEDGTGKFVPTCKHDGKKHIEHDDSYHWTVCDECNQIIENTKTLHDDDRKFSEDGKRTWRECMTEGCGWKGKEECAHKDTHMEYDDDKHSMVCDDCKKTLSVNTHLPQDATSDDGARSWKECFCGWKSAATSKLDKATVSKIPDQVYTGEPLTPPVEVTAGGEKLKEGVDYTVKYENNTDIGKGMVIIDSIGGKSTGKQTKEFEIVEQCDHNWVWVNTDAQNHWQTCTKCQTTTAQEAHEYIPEVVTPATCTQNAVLQMKCRCDRVDPNGRTAPVEGDPAEWFAHHTWGAYTGDSWEHWQVCTVCNVKSEAQKHSVSNLKTKRPPTCLENGWAEFDCPVCSMHVDAIADEYSIARFPELAQYLALGHDFTGPLAYIGSRTVTSEGEGTHAATCTRCGTRDYEHQSPHAFAPHTVANGSCNNPDDPTIIEGECPCGASLRIVKPREHMPVLDRSKDVQATCTEAGQIDGHRCMICGLFYDYTDVPALGHDWEVIDKKKATCPEDGFTKSKCKRCNEEKTEEFPRLSPNGKHHWVAAPGNNPPTCLKDGKYDGEVCTYCGNTQAGDIGYGTAPALGHDTYATITTHGAARAKTSESGFPMDIQCYHASYNCRRCKAHLGDEYWTVGTSSHPPKYEIVPGKNAKITDLKNGVHIDGNMANDGGVYFNGKVMDGLKEQVEFNKSKYQYKKVPSKSFVIEFTDEFLAETPDGEYELIVINGNEFWPMLVTVKDHLLVALRDVDTSGTPELTDAEFDAFLAQAETDGATLRSLYALRQPHVEAENDGAPNAGGDIVVTKLDGDYAFESVVNGETALEAGVDYTVDGDTVTIKADYLNGLSGESELVFRYAPFGVEDAPLPHEPRLTIAQ